MKIARWILILPAAILAVVVVYLIANLFLFASFKLGFIDINGGDDIDYTSAPWGLSIGASFIAWWMFCKVGYEIAPTHKDLTSKILASLGLVLIIISVITVVLSDSNVFININKLSLITGWIGATLGCLSGFVSMDEK